MPDMPNPELQLADEFVRGDFDGVTSLPRGLGGVQDLPLLTAKLLEIGLSEQDVAKILGGNWLRVFSQVWK